MKEEMEEGHFDKQGTYIFGKRDKDEIKDHWLDNINWVKVNSQNQPDADKEEDMDTALEDIKPFNPIPCYKDILTIINPGESILKALKRLGGKKMTASERWKKKKETGESSVQNNADKEKISQLTELAATILSKTGNMDVYQETFEGIRFKLQQLESATSEASSDMFGEMFDEKTKKETDEEGEPASKKVRFDEETKEEEKEEKKDGAQETYWEFKWENKEDAEVHGPHSTSEMQSWTESSYFESGIWVRRVGQQSDFHSSKRVDFELYL